MITIAVLMTCYNRRETTLSCLAKLYAQELPEGVALKIFLVDDGCTDGTGIAVKTIYPDIQVIQGDGSLFWCNGMRLAWEHASKETPEFYLWLNDDVQLCEGAILNLLATYVEVGGQLRLSDKQVSISKSSTSGRPLIVVGSCCDPKTREYTYGGQQRLGRHPAKLASVLPQKSAVECDTFQGNIVLVSRAVYEKIGPMRRFSHAMGDTDYGLRAKEAGVGIHVAPGYVGMCEANHAERSIAAESIVARFKILKKRLPPGDWFRYLWMHVKLYALIYWPKPYLRAILLKKNEKTI